MWRDFCVAGIVVLGVVGLEDEGGMVGLSLCPASAASRCTSRSFRNASGWSARHRSDPTGPWLFKLIFHTLLYLSRSCRVATYVKSISPIQENSV